MLMPPLFTQPRVAASGMTAATRLILAFTPMSTRDASRAARVRLRAELPAPRQIGDGVILLLTGDDDVSAKSL